MKDEKNSPKFRGGKSLVSITLTLVVIGIIFVLLYAYMGILPIPDFLGQLFDSSVRDDLDSDQNNQQLPDAIESEEKQYLDVYFHLTDREIFENLAEPTAYERSMRIIRTYGGVYNSERFQIVKSGDSFRAESKTKTVICDGETVYVKGGAYVNRLDADDFDLYEEVGIHSAEQLLEMVRNEQATFTVDRDAKIITVTTVENVEKIKSTFEISIENGIVTTEYSYQDGVQYRLVVTDSVVMISEDQIDKNQFIIPNT